MQMESYRQLIRQAQRGDADAVTEIVQGFDGLIVAMALRFKTYFPDFEEAKSISTCALIDGIYTYDLMKDTLVVYHFKAQIIRRFNKEKRLLLKHEKQRDLHFYENLYEEDGYLEIPDKAQSLPEEVCIHAEEQALLREGLLTLTKNERDVLHLKYVRCKTHSQIGDILGIHRNRVGTIHKEARKSLKRYLQERQPKRYS